MTNDVLSKIAWVTILAILIGAGLLALFRYIYPHVDYDNVLTVISLVAFLSALGINHFWPKKNKQLPSSPSVTPKPWKQRKKKTR